MFWKTLAFERYAPLILGALSIGLIAYFRAHVSFQFAHSGWKTDNLYSAVFNWASIQSGFVFGIYGFIVSKKDGFAGQIIRGPLFARLLAYARRAYLTGFALTFFSLPIMIVAPSISDPRTLSFWVVAVWFGAFVWTFCAFLRVAFIFGIIAAVPDHQPRIVG